MAAEVLTEPQLTDFVDKTREMIFHENELMNHRMTWLLTSHAVLFAGAAYILEKERTYLGFGATAFLAFVAGGINVSLWVAMQAGEHALERLQRECQQMVEMYRTIGVVYRGPRWVGWGMKDLPRWRRLLFPSTILPSFLLFAWVAWLAIFLMILRFAKHP